MDAIAAESPRLPDDGELVRSTRRGELRAFDMLVERYQRQATAVAFRLLSHREDAMDVVQDAFLRAYSKLGSLAQPDRFGAWFMRIVSNLALNFRRARALRRAEPLDAPDDGDPGSSRLNRPDTSAVAPPAILSAEELRHLLGEAIDELPETQRQALVLFSIQKLPQKEIARMLGCSVEAVKWHVFAARKKLKERFREYL